MELLLHPSRIHLSEHDYEWLGHGFYVWENNLDRALDWATNHYPKFKEPFAIGVVHTLEKCLDLTDKHFIELLSKDFPEFVNDLNSLGTPVPQNTDLRGKPNPGTQFGDKNHIQVCIRNKGCIKFFFASTIKFYAV